MTTLLLRCVCLALIVLAGQYAYTSVRPPKTPLQMRLLKRHLARNADIIYFGDSTVHHAAREDRDKSSIPEMLESKLDGVSVGRVSAAAYNFDLFEKFAEYIAADGRRPRLAIFPVNLASFSPQWDRRPEYQFEREKLYISLAKRPALLMFYRPLAVFSDMQPISEDEYRQTPVFNGSEQVGVLWDFRDERFGVPTDETIRKVLVLRYMGRLRGDHRKVRAMARAADALAAAGVPAIFYITPVDFETGERLLGPAFRERIREHCSVIERALAGKRVRLIDLSFSAESALFNWRQDLYPNEHLKDHGRDLVAQRLGREIEQHVAQVARKRRHQ